MKTALRLTALLLLMLVCALAADAQRRVTPVAPRPGTLGNEQPKRVVDPRRNVVEQRDAQGKIVLVDTVTGLEWVDTTAVAQVKKMQYPLLHSVAVGVNVWDPFMRILGQHYGLFDVWGELSLHNRYKPIVEIGLGTANDTPDGMNYTYKSKLAPFFKIGLNYNIFYNSNPDYQFNVGVRYGFSAFSFEVTDVTVDEGYWDDPSHFSIPSQSTTAGYFEFVAGVKVKIVGPLSLGWNLRYHSIIHEGKAPMGKPMYIPGFGKRGNALTGSFSIIYTIPLNKKGSAKVNTDGADGSKQEN